MASLISNKMKQQITLLDLKKHPLTIHVKVVLGSFDRKGGI